MIEILLSLILFIFLILITGSIISINIFKLDSNSLEIYEVGLLGIIFLVFLSFVFHLIVPLNETFNSFIFILLILLFIFKTEKKIFKSLISDYKFILISFILIFIMTLKYKPNEDYGYYHLPFIINLVSEKIIFGLSNLQPQFGWNSTWLNFSSIFYLPILEIKGTQLSNSLLSFFIFYMLLKEILYKKNKNNISYLFILFLGSYVIIKFSRISEHGFDFPANIYLLLSIFYFIKLFEENNVYKINKYFILVCCFGLFALTVKLSTFIAPIIVLFASFLIYKKKIYLSLIKIPIIFCFAFFLFWLFQQFIFTGCFVPHFKFTCIQSMEWYTNDISKMMSGLTGSVNKSFNHYDGNLLREEYIKDFNWVGTWFERNKIELFEHLAAILLPFIVLFLINIKSTFSNLKEINSLANSNQLCLVTLLILIIFGLSLWFLKSPVIRFGIPYLFSLIFLILITTISLTKVSFNRGIYLIITLCIIFNFTKNVNRVLKNNSKSYWPEILIIDYSTKKQNGFIINYPDSSDKYFKTKLCWSTPYICSVTKGEKLKFYKKFSYTFITRQL